MRAALAPKFQNTESQPQHARSSSLEYCKRSLAVGSDGSAKGLSQRGGVRTTSWMDDGAGLRSAEESTVSGQGKCDKPRDAKLSGNVSVQEASFDMVWQLSANDKADVSWKKIAFLPLRLFYLFVWRVVLATV